MNAIILVHGEPVVDAFGQSHKVSRFDVDAYPLVGFVAYIKVTRATKNVTNFFGIMNMFFEEGFDLQYIGCKISNCSLSQK
jgi:hypothetical protein